MKSSNPDTPHSPKPRAMTPKGFAVIIVVFFSVLILISVTSAAFYSALGTRSGTASDKTSYSMLLAAESGLDTFPTRYALASPQPNFSYPAIPQSGEATSEVSLGSLANLTVGGINVNLSAKTVTTAGNNKYIRITSTATSSSGGSVTSKKVVLRDFTPPSTGGYGNTPAAITSFNSIQVTGNASIAGYDTDVVFGNTRSTPNAVLDALNNTIAVDYNASSVLDAMNINDKVRLKIAGTDYDFSVKALGTNSLNGSPRVTLSPLNASTPLSTLAPSMGNIPIARAPVYTMTSSLSVPANATTSVLPLSAVTGLRVDQNYSSGSGSYNDAQTINLTVGGTTYTGSITNISSNNVTVSWSPKPSSSFIIPADTRVDTIIPALLSKYDISTGGSSETGAIVKYSKWFSARESMFETFFGINKTKMQSSSGVSVVSPNNYQKDMNAYTNKIVYVTGDLSITGQPGLCGTGYILIVDGDLSINQSDNCFKGIVYVTGDFSFQGNPAMKGSIVVEGDTKAKDIEADGDILKITGTGSGTFKMQFDPNIISTLSASIPSSSTFSTTSTWRQK